VATPAHNSPLCLKTCNRKRRSRCLSLSSRTPLQVPAISYTYIFRTPLNASVLVPHLSSLCSLGWTLSTSVSPIPQNRASVRRLDLIFRPGKWPGGVYTVATPNQLHPRAKKDGEEALAIKFDSADNTESVKAGQSQKYLFTPESAPAERLGNT
jgi:hypothetical protein